MADLNEIVEQLSNLSVLEAAELTKLLEEKWGVSASAPMGMPMMAMGAMGGGDAAVAEEEEEQTEFNVVLTDVGPKKINVIKEVRKLTNLGLKEAKAAVDGAPTVLLEAVSKEAANEAKSALEEAGAKVDVK